MATSSTEATKRSAARDDSSAESAWLPAASAISLAARLTRSAIPWMAATAVARLLTIDENSPDAVRNMGSRWPRSGTTSNPAVSERSPAARRPKARVIRSDWVRRRSTSSRSAVRCRFRLPATNATKRASAGKAKPTAASTWVGSDGCPARTLATPATAPVASASTLGYKKAASRRAGR